MISAFTFYLRKGNVKIVDSLKNGVGETALWTTHIRYTRKVHIKNISSHNFYLKPLRLDFSQMV